MKLSTLFSICVMLGFMGIAIMHEQVHIEIYKDYGIDSHIEYFSHFPDLVTVADERCPTEECLLAHNINEVVGYVLIPFYMALMIGLLIIIVIMEERLI